MINIKDINSSLEKDLFITPDHNGESIYFLDENLENPYTGILIETSGNTTIWWSEIVDGVQNGIEKNFDNDGQLEQISEYRNNMQFGVSKEFDELGNLSSISIVWDNAYIRSVFLNCNKQLTKIIEKKDWINSYPLPDDFKKLLNLTDQELINYQFHYTLWKE